MSTSSHRIQSATALPKRINNENIDDNQKTDQANQSSGILQKYTKALLKGYKKIFPPLFRMIYQKIKNHQVQIIIYRSYGFSPRETKSSLRGKIIRKRNFIIEAKKWQNFYVFDERELGYSNGLEDQLNQPYEEDDDIDTRQSIVNHFVEVCKRDLVEGIQRQKGETPKQQKEQKMSSKK